MRIKNFIANKIRDFKRGGGGVSCSLRHNVVNFSKNSLDMLPYGWLKIAKITGTCGRLIIAH